MPVTVKVWADSSGISRITAEGHTGMGPRQSDVACAAVSAAMEVLAEACEARDPRPMGRVIREDGYMDIRLIDIDSGRRNRFATVAAPVVAVLRAVGRLHPGSVSVEGAESFSRHLARASDRAEDIDHVP
ncbi:MAG: hypothetical protein CVV64_03665 [Candidatus Wallbacteria bacterium HGW-Wallbacteria-1]|jgi:uncharacterized protein YsxB (DUF464 family)|uniref:Ribosomal processing cysteine protease Prp n=1 Tax=Candidatus Wallbacteria bacterium HGW-Wallbacteria-1 TaxID=2013854 RepID=A0A2N1PU18_9BACT|nr:MAG: hypothetical protein CVV64_03665 [Candidatus Wallbacteria bacterium HGW-Wallbacteria-1]